MLLITASPYASPTEPNLFDSLFVGPQSACSEQMLPLVAFANYPVLKLTGRPTPAAEPHSGPP
jgi:hypothetical protein